MGQFSPEMQAAYAAICSAGDNTLSGLLKNTGSAEGDVAGDLGPAAADASSELFAVRSAVGVLPSLEAIGAGIGVAGAIGATGYLGWKIGRFIDTQFLHITPKMDDVAASTYNGLTWNYHAARDMVGHGYQMQCATYVPATGCQMPVSQIPGPDWSKAQAGDPWVDGRGWWLDSSQGGMAGGLDLWAGVQGLVQCMSLPNYECGQAVRNLRSSLASSLPRLDVYTVPSNTLENDGYNSPNAEPLTYGAFLYRTTAEMVKHYRFWMEPYTNQSYQASSSVSVPSDAAIAAGGRSQLLAHGNEGAARVIGHELDPSDVPNVTEVKVPSCYGLDYFGCVTALRQAGLLGNIVRLTLDFNSAVIAAGPDGVVKTSPKLGTTIKDTDTVTVTANPGVAGMPILVPEIDAGTAKEDAASALTAVHLNPVFDVNAAPDPQFGPDTVTDSTTAPRAHTRAHYGDDVHVSVNGPDAREPAGGGGGACSAWVTPRVDLSPLTVAPLADRFPFGVPMWTYTLLTSWVVSASAPRFTFPIPFVSPDPVVDLSIFNSAMPIWRATVLFVSFALLAWSFMGMVLGTSAAEDE